MNSVTSSVRKLKQILGSETETELNRKHFFGHFFPKTMKMKKVTSVSHMGSVIKVVTLTNNNTDTDPNFHRLYHKLHGLFGNKSNFCIVSVSVNIPLKVTSKTFEIGRGVTSGWGL